MKKMGGILAALILAISTTCLAAIPQFPVTQTEGTVAKKSKDNRITAYYYVSVHGVPNVERFADIWEVIDRHFFKARGPAKLEIHYRGYNEFVRGVEAKFPGSSKGIKEGSELYQAYTYIKANSQFPVIVIETYQPMDDNTFIHELLHHYFEYMTADGSLNNHYIISQYSHHVESQIRFMLRKKY